VTIGALANSTIIGITVLWIALYGSGFLLTLLPNSYPSPDRLLRKLPFMLQGHYDTAALGDLALNALMVTLAAVIVGMIGFSRKDV
jgi:ABC-2 type transport system permease protein